MSDIDTEKRASGKQIPFKVLSVIVSSLITIFGLYESLKTNQACFVFGVCAIMLIVIAVIIKRQYPDKFWTVLLNGIVILFLSSAVFIYNVLNEVNGSAWYESIRKDDDERLVEMKLKADGGDGIAQMELSDYYDEHKDYEHANKYALKAAYNGNARAYERLAHYYLYGLGGKVDIHQAITNTINAMRIEREVNLPILKEMEDRGVLLSSTDSLRLNRCVSNAVLFDSIYQEASSIIEKEGWVAFVEYIEKNHSLIENASTDGYRPATELLYVSEFMKHPQGSDELHRLAAMLYQSSYLPTQTLDRTLFLRSYHRNNRYDTNYYLQYIKDNDYAFLVFGNDILRWVSPKKMSDYTNNAVISEYELYRAQYEWFKRLELGVIKPVSYIWHGYLEETTNEKAIANELLRRSIEELQDRMDNPAERDTTVYDLMTSRAVAIHIATPWSKAN